MLVNLKTTKIKAINFYWKNRDRYNISLDELQKIGITDDSVWIDDSLIDNLKKINNELKKHGYELLIKEGYRPKKLYNLVYKKRSQKYGAENVKNLLNMEKMPHTSGTVIDAGLWNIKSDKEELMRNHSDGAESLFINFYKNKTDNKSKKYQKLQKMLRDIMLKNNFILGSKKEFFHFEYNNKK